MMNMTRAGLLVVAAVGATLTVGACSNTTANQDSATSSSQTSAAAAPSTTGAQTAQAHNDADVTFAQGMIPHHQQAVEMSDMLLGKQGIDPAVVTLANEIKAAQGPEIETMQGWLSDWNAPSSEMPDMSEMPGHDMSSMGGGGMMSEQDMAALQNAQGAAASKLFLTQMIEHHKGAIAMAQTEVDSGQFPAATEMARTIIASQQQEIDSMESMLASM
jgi:uncharacterized protein (DUF305 family)